jgi:hypothetical protein
MKLCQRCSAKKATPKGTFCKGCAQHFNMIKRGQHAFKFVSRDHHKLGRQLGRPRRQPSITLSPLSWEAPAQPTE